MLEGSWILPVMITRTSTQCSNPGLSCDPGSSSAGSSRGSGSSRGPGTISSCSSRGPSSISPSQSRDNECLASLTRQSCLFGNPYGLFTYYNNKLSLSRSISLHFVQ